jgi:hypothetical protein
MQRLIAAAILVVLLSTAGMPPRRVAAAEWCDTDPVVMVRTPAGNVVPVYVLIGVLGAEHLPAAQAASIVNTTYLVRAKSGGDATGVRLQVLIPDDSFGSGFPTRATASSGPMGSGIVYDRTDGTSGVELVLVFTLDVP